MIIKKNKINIIILTSISIFIFLFSFNRDLFDYRLIITIPFFISLYKIMKTRKLLSKKEFLTVFFILFYILLNSQINLLLREDRIYNLYSIFFLVICIVGIYNYSEILLKNYNFIFYFFLIILFLHSILFRIYENETYNVYHQCFIGCYSVIKSPLQLFEENSHLGFTSTSVIIFLILKAKSINYNLFFLIIFYIFLIYNYSLTIFFSMFFFLLILITIFFEKFNNLQKANIFLITFFSLYLIISNSNSLDRINTLINLDNWNSSNNQKENNYKNFNSKSLKQNTLKKDRPKNLSSEVYIVSLKISLKSLFDKPLGYGFNNYHVAYNKYIDDIYIENKTTKKLNKFDGSNNLSKLLVEFGFLSLLIFYLIYKFFSNGNIDYQHKILILPSILTQIFLRGGGYFNGGFIFFIILIFFLNYKSKKIKY